MDYEEKEGSEHFSTWIIIFCYRSAIRTDLYKFIADEYMPVVFDNAASLIFKKIYFLLSSKNISF